MKILITGAGGQLGRALQQALQQHELVALTHTQLNIASFNNANQAVMRHRPDLVINTAAFTNVDAAEQHQREANEVNAVGPRNLAVTTGRLNIPLVQISTDYVFDGRGTQAYYEADRTNPLSVYGKTKLAGEQAVIANNTRHYIVRTAWLYAANEEARNFPKTMLNQADKAEVKVVNDQFGSPTYAPHLAIAIGQLIETKAFGLYHLAGRGGTTWFELTRKLYELFNVQTTVRPVTTEEFPRAAPRPRYSVLTTNKQPEILLPPWEDGLAEFAAQLRGAL